MNFALFKATAKSNWVLGVIFFVVMAMYLSIIVSMYDPGSMDALNGMLETLPKELVSAMGFDSIANNLTAFIASYYYGFIIIMFPLIYCIIAANRLIAKHIDRGSMAYLLSTPNTRVKIAATQAIYLIVSITILFVLIALSGIAISESMFKGSLDIGGFLLMNFCALLTFYAISGICFFFSCAFNDTKYSLAFGAGIPLAFFVINMLRNVSSDYSWMKNLTLFSLFDPASILAGDAFTAAACIILTVLATLLYGGGILLFNRRSLPL